MQTLFDDNDLEDSDDDGQAAFVVFSEDEICDSSFAHFRETGFPSRDLAIHTCQQQINKLAAMPLGKQLMRSNVAYQVADTYHPHRFTSHAYQMRSPVDSFNDDDQLRRAIRMRINKRRIIPENLFGELLYVKGTQACWNFRPGFASFIYRTYAKKGDTVLDTSTGYGGRIVGYLAAKLDGHYIGIDPNIPTYHGNMAMVNDLGRKYQFELYCEAVEDLSHDPLFTERCDFAFTSPPYFKKEVYSHNDTQSWKRYGHDADVWREEFLLPMFKLQYAALKPDTTNVVNIAPVRIQKTVYPLDEWAREAGEQAGFKYIETRRFSLAKRHGANMDEAEAFEPVLVFRKRG